MAFAFEAPAYWSPDLAGQPGNDLGSDLCVINGEHFFIRGNIEIPVLATGETFSWGVWASLSEASFLHTTEHWKLPGRETNPPYFGWLSSDLPFYEPPTLDLKTHVHTRPLGERPAIELEPTDHPLAIDQHTGITSDRLRELVSLMPHSKLS